MKYICAFILLLHFSETVHSQSKLFSNYKIGGSIHPNMSKFSLTPVADQVRSTLFSHVKVECRFDTDQDGISDEEERRGYSRYWQIEGEFTWHEAMDDAINRGGFLATIPSEIQHLRVLNSVKKRKLSWLGGHDMFKQNQWQWVTGEKWTFSKWNKGEPNNYGGREDGLMLCFGKNYEYWNDAKTSSRCSYILEKVFKTNPFLADSDGDGFQDLIEIKNGFDPNDSNSRPYKNYILP